MKHFLAAFVSLSALVLTALAQPPADPPAKVDGLELPASQSVQADEQFVRVKAVTSGTEVAWLVTSSSKVKWKPVSAKEIDVGCPPGAVIRVYGTAVVGGKLTGYACTVLTVAGTPAPGPPVPIPPSPDQLKAALTAAWSAETDPRKTEALLIYAALFDKAATKYVADPKYKTIGDLLLWLESVDKEAMVGDKSVHDMIPGIHRAAGDWLDKQVPPLAKAPLDDATRAKLKTAFTQLSEALGGLK